MKQNICMMVRDSNQLMCCLLNSKGCTRSGSQIDFTFFFFIHFSLFLRAKFLRILLLLFSTRWKALEASSNINRNSTYVKKSRKALIMSCDIGSLSSLLHNHIRHVSTLFVSSTFSTFSPTLFAVNGFLFFFVQPLETCYPFLYISSFASLFSCFSSFLCCAEAIEGFKRSIRPLKSARKSEFLLFTAAVFFM